MTLLRLDARCPRCKRQPAIRVFSDVPIRFNHDGANKPILTAQCQKCREVYVVKAGALHNATV